MSTRLDAPADDWASQEPVGTPNEITGFARISADASHWDRVSRKVEELRILEDARALLVREKLQAIVRPPLWRLDEFLGRELLDPCYAVDQLLPTGGRFVLTGRRKLGKSTLMGNLLRAMADGEPFLGRFAVAKPLRVALIDLELDERTLRRWLTEQDIQNTHAVTILNLRGSAQTFGILDDQVRATWAKELSGHDVIILDCLRPALDALGLDEHKEAGRFLTAFDALLSDAGASEGGLVHHAGHGSDRARGDSRIEDWPDAIWRMSGGKGKGDPTHDQDGPRYFSAVGRDVNFPESELTYTSRTRRLSIAEGAPTKAEAESSRRSQQAEAAVLAAIKEHPGIGARELRDACRSQGVPRNPDTDAAVARLTGAGIIQRRKVGRALKHFLAGSSE